MTGTRIAMLSLGCVCTLSAYAETFKTEGLQENSPAIMAPRYETSASYLTGTDWHYLDEHEQASIAGFRWQFDSGLWEGVHKVVGFWPSIHWLNSNNIGTSMASLGYTWRNLRLEGALFKGRDSDQYRNTEFIRIDSSAKRLAYQFGPNWALRLSRRFHTSPDQLRSDIKIRRTTASATYRNNIGGNPWDTTLAVGRGRGTASNLYLLESAMRVGREHTFFGRIERGGNDELFRHEDAPSDRVYQVNKLTVGYLHDVMNIGSTKLGVGALVSRRAVPEELLPYYGTQNNSYMVFFRLQMQFAAN